MRTRGLFYHPEISFLNHLDNVAGITSIKAPVENSLLRWPGMQRLDICFDLPIVNHLSEKLYWQIELHAIYLAYDSGDGDVYEVVRLSPHASNASRYCRIEVRNTPIMKSWYGNVSVTIEPLWSKAPYTGGIPSHKASNSELWRVIWYRKQSLKQHWIFWRFEVYGAHLTSL